MRFFFFDSNVLSCYTGDMITQTARYLHRLPTWAYLLLVTLILSIGMIVIVSSVSAQMFYGGKVMSYVSGPSPGGPCIYGMGITIGPPVPSAPPCILWLAGPMPPIGSWVKGMGSVNAVIIGAFGF